MREALEVRRHSHEYFVTGYHYAEMMAHPRWYSHLRARQDSICHTTRRGVPCRTELPSSLTLRSISCLSYHGSVAMPSSGTMFSCKHIISTLTCVRAERVREGAGPRVDERDEIEIEIPGAFRKVVMSSSQSYQEPRDIQTHVH